MDVILPVVAGFLAGFMIGYEVYHYSENESTVRSSYELYRKLKYHHEKYHRFYLILKGDCQILYFKTDKQNRTINEYFGWPEEINPEVGIGYIKINISGSNIKSVLECVPYNGRVLKWTHSGHFKTWNKHM